MKHVGYTGQVIFRKCRLLTNLEHRGFDLYQNNPLKTELMNVSSTYETHFGVDLRDL